MKLLTLFVSLFIGLSAQASDTLFDNIPQDYSIQLEADTQVVALTLRTKFAVNCPGTLNLRDFISGKNKITVEYDTRVNDAYLDLMDRASKTCAEEIFEITNPLNQFTCLSIGFESGVVYIETRHMGAEEIVVTHPGILGVTEVRQLK